MDKRMKWLTLISLILLVGCIWVTNHSLASSTGRGNTVEVDMDNFSFTPPVVTVKPDTPVRWTNHDDVPHTVVSDDKQFKSGVLDSGDNFTFTPTKPGTYSYFCSVHPKMTGKVVVEAR